ncbi:PIN domain-containing protein [candidate division KSB1 bacterium]|nr:PIN domain-containing protein [candidate division KSB1 bacterium]
MFLDTNIFIYSFDNRYLQKQSIADNLIQEAISSSNGCISYQVIQEFLNVALKKFEKPFTTGELNNLLSKLFEPLCEIFSTIDLYRTALDIKDIWHYSFYNSLIIVSAFMLNCKTLYSEDMQH